MSVGKGKSQLDLARDEHFRLEAERRKALSGPFRCPKCHADLALYCQTDTRDEEQLYTNLRGEVKVKLSLFTRYLFACRSCGFMRGTGEFGKPSVIDEYNRVYDEELSERAANELRKSLKIPRHKVLQLRECEVRMR